MKILILVAFLISLSVAGKSQMIDTTFKLATTTFSSSRSGEAFMEYNTSYHNGTLMTGGFYGTRWSDGKWEIKDTLKLIDLLYRRMNEANARYYKSEEDHYRLIKDLRKILIH